MKISPEAWLVLAIVCGAFFALSFHDHEWVTMVIQASGMYLGVFQYQKKIDGR